MEDLRMILNFLVILGFFIAIYELTEAIASANDRNGHRPKF